MQRRRLTQSAMALATLAALVAVLQPAPAAAAEQPEILVELERNRIYEGQSVVYHVIVNHVDNPPEPDLKGLKTDFAAAALGQRSLNSHMVTIIDGHMSEVVRSGRQYDYRLTPKRTGVLTIPGPMAEVG